MLKFGLQSVLPLLALAQTAVAVCGIHSFTSCADGIVHWFDPNTGEICDPLDCGGGRAAPRTDVPGCPLYSGTATLATSASYLSCWTPLAAVPTTFAITTAAEPSTTATPPAAATPTTSDVASPAATTATTETTAAPATTPSTTAAATLSSTVQTPSNGTITTGGTLSPSSSGPASTSAPATKSTNAGSFARGSLVGVVGAAIAAALLM